MNKQAVLITAYRDENQLVRLVRQFAEGPLSENFKVIVHIDKKSRELNVEKLDRKLPSTVSLYSKYAIAWGSVLHLRAILDMVAKAVADEQVKYIHVVSGTDIALHCKRWFIDRFSDCREVYFGCGDLKPELTYAGGGGGRIIDMPDKHVWYGHYWPPSVIGLSSPFVSFINKVVHKVQYDLNFRRSRIGSVGFENLRFSMVWGSFPREAAMQALKFARKNTSFMSALNSVYVPEEVFWATALYGTHNQIRVGYPTIRYDVWSRKERPAVLTYADVLDVVKRIGEFAFARKVDSVRSAEFVSEIEKVIERE